VSFSRSKWRAFLRAAVSILVLGLLALPSGGWSQGASDPLVVMSFNIRYGTAADGDHSWEHRRALVQQVITDQAPDVLAIQEGLAFQLRELEGALQGYRKLGQHRDGGLEGEFSGLYVREDRVGVLRWGEIWLSQSPDSVGSRGWDAALPRMAVWVEIQGPGRGPTLRVYGTHFDHRGSRARLESARLILRHAAGGPPAIVMGDLNAGEDSEPLMAFFDKGYQSAFRVLHPGSDLGTFNGFRDTSGGDRIDHILLDPRLRVVRSEILDLVVEGIFPSDHFPVTATAVLRDFQD
jgi:endonuclease/exonuclease/phosphatase family metal-dependent hydrolase